MWFCFYTMLNALLNYWISISYFPSLCLCLPFIRHIQHAHQPQHTVKRMQKRDSLDIQPVIMPFTSEDFTTVVRFVFHFIAIHHLIFRPNKKKHPHPYFPHSNWYFSLVIATERDLSIVHGHNMWTIFEESNGFRATAFDVGKSWGYFKGGLLWCD